MWRISWFLLAVVMACVAVGCSRTSGERPAVVKAVMEDRNSAEISIGKETAVFRKISPQAYQFDYPEFLLLETEVTNRMYREYLLATGKRKDDTDVLEIIHQRNQPVTTTTQEIKDGFANKDGWQVVGAGEMEVFRNSTGDIPYQVRDEKTIWRDNNYPAGFDDHPVALVTIFDAITFCEWLSKTHPDKGLFRLPTWNEWMIAAYGSSRAYPWCDHWDPALALTSYGSLRDDSRIRTEPTRARPQGRTPEGLYGLLGNASEYLIPDEPREDAYYDLGASWMGGGFADGRMLLDDGPQVPHPRNDYWGYSHHPEMRDDEVGFRVVLDVKKDRSLISRPQLLKQQNSSWRTKSD